MVQTMDSTLAAVPPQAKMCRLAYVKVGRGGRGLYLAGLQTCMMQHGMLPYLHIKLGGCGRSGCSMCWTH